MVKSSFPFFFLNFLSRRASTQLFFPLLFVTFVYLSFLLCHHTACRILVPWPGMEPQSMEWKGWVLTTGPPGNFPFCIAYILIFFFLNKWGFPGGSVAKNLPSSMGHASSVPGLGGSTWRGATKPVGHNYWACALEPRSPNYWAHIAVTPEACLPAPEPVLCNKKAHHKQKPSHCNLESSPNSLELEHELSNEDPEQPKISK